ncbi:MAG: hypothetical protein AUK63_910 [bacterium P3]|nr:MAG: hypothetical protein AUK64_1067 [bacterium P201]KWW30464.1 MAG: hypothetical protein AUK63_910 [bacterium P3]KWW41351.1 MAG: hypothetical protein F083_1098 [bacterium F083]
MKIPTLLRQDRWVSGLLAVIASELPLAALWATVLALSGLPAGENLRWLAPAFIPPVLLLRHMAKRRQTPEATKGAIVTLFGTFMVFIVFYLKAS